MQMYENIFNNEEIVVFIEDLNHTFWYNTDRYNEYSRVKIRKFYLVEQ